MALITKQFDQYSIIYHTKPDQNIIINVHCLKENTHVGTISFLAGGHQDIDTYQWGKIFLKYSEEHYSRIMDILRNEKPLYLKFNDNIASGWLTTAYEEVGEEES